MLAFVHTAVTYIVPFLLVLTLVVTIHELGHFWVAKACGVAIDRFAIGFGKAIVSWRDRSGVEWQIGWLPLGGYVKFSGDENAASVPDQEDLNDLRKQIVAHEGSAAVQKYFHFKPLWQRALIVVAGPMANFLLAIVLFAILLGTLGERVSPARVDMIQPGQPAALAGFQIGDQIKVADGRRIRSFADLQQIIMLRAGEPVRFVVDRGGSEVILTATPARRDMVDPMGTKHSVGVLGFGYVQKPSDQTWTRYGPIEAVVLGAERTWSVLDTTVF